MKKLLVVGGLTLILFGAVYGGIYGGFYLPGVKKAMNNSIKEGLKVSSESPDAAQKLGDKFVRKILFDDRMSNVHSHATLFGIMALAVAQFVNRFKLPCWALLSAIWMLLLSGLILPAGVFIETWKVKFGAYMALWGGFMFITAVILFLIGAIRSVRLSDEQI